MSQERITAGYELESVIINSSRMIHSAGIELRALVTDIEIYEHINLPYLTGKLAFLDNASLHDRIDIQGCETVTIRLKESVRDKSVEKVFIIDKQIDVTKSGQTHDLITLHLIDELGYFSRMKNVNKCYFGAPHKIISDIAKDYLNVDVVNEISDVYQSKIKVIIPNLTPVEAMVWVLNRATTSVGSPCYLFSILVANNLVMSDLNTMMSQKPMNPFSPYVFGATAPFYTELEDNGFTIYPILSYKQNGSENLSYLMQRGLVGAQYHYYDSQSATFKKSLFTVKNAYKNMPKENFEYHAFPDKVSFEEENLEIDRVSKNLYQISQSGVYDDGTSRYKSFEQEDDPDGHILKANGRSLQEFMHKSSITVRVPGNGFLNSKRHTGIGRKLRIGFLQNTDNEDGRAKFDRKKSGDFLILSVKHTFTKERYDVTMNMSRLTNLKDNSVFRK